MIIIGIDPGTAETGYGIIKCEKKETKLICHGTIKTSKDDAAPVRLNSIHEDLMALIKEHKPEVLAVESLFFNINAKSASAVGQAIGVVMLAAAKNEMKVFEYPPLRIKMILTGKGRAEKKEVQSGVRKQLRIRKIPRPTHAADALAVAIVHWMETGK